MVPSPLPSGPLIYNGPNGPIPIPPLYEAVLRNDRAKVESLLASGTNANEPCPCGTSPLEAAVAQVKSPEITELLLSHGAEVNARTKPNSFGTTNNWTALFYAVYDKRADLVKLLLKYRAKVSLIDVQGKSPLYLAKERNSPDIVQQLKAAGATDNISAGDLHSPRFEVPAKEFAIYAPRPEYPLSVRKQHKSGAGVFVLNLDSNTGNVTSVKVQKSTGVKELDESVVKTFSQWRFKPHLNFTKVNIPIAFTLPKEPMEARTKQERP
jgi:TonB family protein